METGEHAHPFPVPGAPPEPARREDRDRPSWPASAGLIGILVALTATLVLSGVVAGLYAAAGVDHPSDVRSFTFVTLGLQTVAFVASALLIAGRSGKVSLRQFGFRKFEAAAVGWAGLALVCYFLFAAVYAQVITTPCQNLLETLGADKSTLLAVLTAIFVIGIAPPVEEFFFRGFVYQGFRQRLGVLGGAFMSGALFGVVHFDIHTLVPLAVLGFILALVFQRTNSLWPCILIHAFNNTLAFAVGISSPCN